MGITYIYLVENCYGDPNKIYIGKSKHRKERKNSHKYKFGKQIEYNIIDEINSLLKKDWKPLETYWIQQFKVWGFKIINSNEGGGGPVFHSEGAKKKIGEKVSSKLKGRISPMKGRKHSKETKKQQSQSAMGKHKGGGMKDKKHKKESILKICKPIRQIDPKTNKIIKEYKSVDDALKELNIKGISNVLSGRAKTAGNYKWGYKKLN